VTASARTTLRLFGSTFADGVVLGILVVHGSGWGWWVGEVVPSMLVEKNEGLGAAQNGVHFLSMHFDSMAQCNFVLLICAEREWYFYVPFSHAGSQEKARERERERRYLGVLSVSGVDGRPHYIRLPWGGPRQGPLEVSQALTTGNVSNEASRPHQKHKFAGDPQVPSHFSAKLLAYQPTSLCKGGFNFIPTPPCREFFFAAVCKTWHCMGVRHCVGGWRVGFC